MILDDRLDTVLRTPAAGVAAARIRFRQLIDLLGRLPDHKWSDPHRAALVALDQFGDDLPEADRIGIIESTTIRAVELVRHLATAEARVAGAALRVARLNEATWLDLIPQLPIRARGFLRHRNDLGPKVDKLLERFGVGDFALPQPEHAQPSLSAAHGATATQIEALEGTGSPDPVVSPATLSVAGSANHITESLASDLKATEPLTGIGAIVRRIEAFRLARSHAQEKDRADPRLPFGDETDTAPPRIEEIQFRTDAEGAIVWADGPVQQLVWGHTPFTAEADAPARCDLGTLRAVRGRTPIREGRLDLDGVQSIRGAWRIDAIPLFADRGGRFTGYLGRLRRPRHEACAPPSDGSDRLRQLLHELRTPINAIQGFSELIQQQIFGPTPHEYRSLAASIAADAARILGGFDEIDRLVKLEAGHLSAEPGSTDLGQVFDRLMAQVEQVVASRGVKLKVERSTGALPVGVDELELERMVWRVLAVIASAAQPGERLRFVLLEDDADYMLSLPLPASLALREDEELFAPDSSGATAFPSTAMLGSGFALRLAGAEARACGGSLKRDGTRLLLALPTARDAGYAMPLANSATPD